MRALSSTQRLGNAWGRALTLGVTILLTQASFAANPKIAKDFPVTEPGKTVDVIVQFRQVPAEAQHAKVRGRGGELKHELSASKASAYSLPAEALESLADDPDVTYISPDRPVRGASFEYAAPSVSADLAWKAGWDGRGIGVAIIDSGVDSTLPDLWIAGSPGKSRVVYSEDFTGSGNTKDAHGHGTHVAGLVAGNGAASTGSLFTTTFKGSAPQANLISLKVLDSQGMGTESAVINAIQRAIALKKTYNIRVINLSLGRPVFEAYNLDPLCLAVEAAWKAGIVVVVAAGNDGRDNTYGTEGYGLIASPANDPYVITVGAMKTAGTASRGDDTVASYSSKGPTAIDHFAKPDLVAPGNRSVSLLDMSGSFPKTYPANMIALNEYTVLKAPASSPSYYKLSGTSMATPVVSAAAALLLQQDASLTPDQVKARLMKTASKNFPVYSVSVDPVTGATYQSQYDIFTIGAGYLDISAALASTEKASGTALSPRAAYNATTGQVTLVFDPSAVWGTSAAWGSRMAWGSTVFLSGTSAVWGAASAWGSSGTQGFGAIWGSSAAWGSKTAGKASTTSINAATGVASPESINIAIYGDN